MAKTGPKKKIVPDPDPLPAVLQPKSNARSVEDILALPDKTKVEFRFGDFIPNAESFNTYLEATVPPGSKLIMAREQVVRLVKELAMSLNSGGLDGLPQVCLGKECHLYESCPLQRAGAELPVGSSCPVERTEILGTLRSLRSDFGDGTTEVDRIQMKGLTGIQTLKKRVFADMSKSPSPVITQKKGVDHNGKALFEKVENPNYAALDKLLKMEQALMKSLHLTHEQRKKEELNGPRTMDNMEKRMKEKLAELRKNKNAKSLDVIDLNPKQEKQKEDQNDETIPLQDRPTDLGGRAPSQLWVQDSADAGDKLESPGGVGQEEGNVKIVESVRVEVGGERDTGGPTGGRGTEPGPHPDGGSDGGDLEIV